jgi:hypothetical protein
MRSSLLFYLSLSLMSYPFLAIGAILAHHLLRRTRRWRGKWRPKRIFGYYPSAFALGMALQFLQVFFRPSVEYVLEAKLDEASEEDDQGNPDSAAKQLNRQLKGIRRGEPVDRLVLRL